MRFFRILIGVYVFVGLLGCASTELTETSNPEETTTKMATDSEGGAGEAKPKVETAEYKAETDGILEEQTPAASGSSSSANPLHSKVMERLKALGYEGVGLELESNEMLTFLDALFTSPVMARRKIKRVYTGWALEYDSKAEAITIGGTSDKAKILSFIKKKVPLNKVPQKTNNSR